MQVQNVLFEDDKPLKNSSTFTNNMKLPVHRWFRFSAGFSSQWVQNVIKKEIEKKGPEITLLDPFVGSGTALLSSDECNICSYGIEAQPFLAKIAKFKTNWNYDTDKFIRLTDQLLKKANNYKGVKDKYPDLIYKCYSNEVLSKLEGLKRAWFELDAYAKETDLVWLAITCILRPVSKAGTAQWQYVLPKKSKKKIVDVFEGFWMQSFIMKQDIDFYINNYGHPKSKFIVDSSMFSNEVPEDSIDLLVTSPPYANNYDYADATRLEMSFWNEITGWADLHEKARKNLLRACSQHASKEKEPLESILDNPNLEPIKDELIKVTYSLKTERQKHGGKKQYHRMIAGYFSDMAKVWLNLRRMCKKGSTVCFVIGDSAPYGIYVPVEKWIGNLALSAGFKSYEFEKLRDRNIKWKNRKHRIPLKEGNLWVYG